MASVLAVRGRCKSRRQTHARLPNLVSPTYAHTRHVLTLLPDNTCKSISLLPPARHDVSTLWPCLAPACYTHSKRHPGSRTVDSLRHVVKQHHARHIGCASLETNLSEPLPLWLIFDSALLPLSRSPVISRGIREAPSLDTR